MNRIKVNVSNGTSGDIWCKLETDKCFTTRKQINAGIDASVVGGGLNAGIVENYEWKTANEIGYMKVGPSRSFKFSEIADGGRVFLTVQDENRKEICTNFVITRDETVIVDKDSNITLARKDGLVDKITGQRNKWIDSDGVDHKPNKDGCLVSGQEASEEKGDSQNYKIQDDGGKKDHEGDDSGQQNTIQKITTLIGKVIPIEIKIKENKVDRTTPCQDSNPVANTNASEEEPEQVTIAEKPEDERKNKQKDEEKEDNAENNVDNDIQDDKKKESDEENDN